MTEITQLQAGNFSLRREDVRVFETLPDLRSFALVEPAKVLLTDQTIIFPNPTRDLWYHYAGLNISGSTYTSGCLSYTAILGEEWGPGRAQNIDDIYLADMPPYTRFLDARIKLSRTDAPDNILDRALPTICVGEWTDLAAGGGATIIEGWLGVFCRKLSIELDFPGEAVVKAYLRLWQSIRPRNLTTVGSTSTAGWTVGASNAGVFAKLEANEEPTVYHDIGAGSPGAHWKERNGGNQNCKQSVSGDWSSTYFGDIEITPGVN